MMAGHCEVSGHKFPDFELPDQEGKVLKLSQRMRGWPTIRNREIYKIYNGWWFVGRPTVEELRLDLRAVMSRRPDYTYQRAWDESEEARQDAFL